MACDAWTSSNRKAFLAIVVSFITEDWRLEEVLLDFIELHGAHDGKNMAEALKTVLMETGLIEKVSSIACCGAVYGLAWGRC